jgi:NAD(P)H-dependent FMN reductase
MLEQKPIKVLALVGSLRAESVNRQLAELAAQTAPDGVTVTVFDGLGDVPFTMRTLTENRFPRQRPGYALRPRLPTLR